MTRVCGPIVGFRGQDGDAWRLTIMAAYRDEDNPGPLSLDGVAVPPVALGDAGGVRVFAWTFSVPLQDSARPISYTLAGDAGSRSINIPARGQYPRLAYASCNGFSDPGDIRRTEDKYVSWKKLQKEHTGLPFHLLLLGGDQIYADGVWRDIEELREFNEQPRAARQLIAASPDLPAAIERYYTEAYCQRFSASPVADLLASIPTLMMWDDHDIFDGWGSYSDAEQASDVFQTVYRAARRCFQLFQLAQPPADPASGSWPSLPEQGGFNALLRLGELGLLVLDLRSERTQGQILAPASWNAVLDALDASRGLRHLLVMSSIPVVHPDLTFVQQALDVLPGQQELEDDLHDQWNSYSHRTEQIRLLHRLLDFAEANGTRVTILSGDVHVAALGVVESTRRPSRWMNANVINQLTSSPIVHPPPARIVRWLLERLGAEVRQIDRGITLQMLQFPGTDYRFIARRNWLSLDVDEQRRIWVNWFVDGADQPITKVVHPCERLAAEEIAALRS